jgi:hypothetical protein
MASLCCLFSADGYVHDDLIEKIRATSNQVEGIIDTENASSVKLA